MTQKQREKFWKACYENVRIDSHNSVFSIQNRDCSWSWRDPEEASLETLLDVLERLTWEDYLAVGVVAYVSTTDTRYAAQGTNKKNQRTSLHKKYVYTTRKAAVIAAICALTGVEMEASDARE